jgi:hypothetical protein
MFIDQITLAEGSVLENLTVASGTLFPPHANSGELFFRTDIDNGSLYIYAGGQWLKSSNVANVTPLSIGLGNVNNTSDNNKPVSAAQQAAIALKANITSLATVAFSGDYAALINKPSANTLNLGNVDNTSDLNKPISIATQTALNLKTDDAILHAVAKSGDYNQLSNKPATVTLISLGLNNVNNTSDANKPISIAQQAALNLKANNSSLSAVAISGSYLDLTNTPTVTASSLGLHAVATSGDFNSLTNKPAAPTKSAIGLGNVDNTSDASKPISTATQDALDLKTTDSTLHQVAKSGNYTHLTNKPVITPATLGLHSVATSGNYNELNNKPIITAATIGLENVDNTSDASKPISTATQDALDLKTTDSTLHQVAKSGNYTHLTNKPVIPTVTKTSLGLDNVDNTSDINKPISSATQDALDLKANLAILKPVATTGSYNDLTDKPVSSGSYTLPVATAFDLGGVKQGAGITISVDGTISASSGSGGGPPTEYTLPVASASVLGGVMIGSGLLISSGVLSTNLSTVATSGNYADLSNKPSAPTKTSLGLGNVDNTSDINKPISSATQDALDLKLGIGGLATVATSGDYADLLNAPTLNKAAVGLSNVDNTSDLNKPISAAQSSINSLKANISSLATVATSGDYADLTNKPTTPTATSLGLADVATSGSYNDLSDKPTISTATKASVGLGNVDNTSDVNKPVSSAQQGALDLKANISSLATVATSGSYLDLANTPTIPVATKTSVGLGNVDNTSDINKPISSATQDALDLKLNAGGLATVATSGQYADLTGTPVLAAVATSGSYTDLSDKPAITKAAIGLGSVENTSDANKIISTLTQTALNLKADISALGATAFSNDYNDLINTPSGGSYTLPIASVATLGGIKIGTGLTVDIDGTVNASGGGGYTLPIASSSVLGGVKQGAGLLISAAGEISFNVGLSDLAFPNTSTVAYIGDVFLESIYDLTNSPSNYLTPGDTLTYVHEIDSSLWDVSRFYLLPGDPDWLDINDPQYYRDFWTNKPQTGGATKASIGLGNVDNTSDTNKPISTATQNALDNKLDISAVALVGTSGLYSDLGNIPSTFKPPIATASVLGGIKVGSGLLIDGAGVLSSTGGYTLPVASIGTLGGVKQGSGITIAGDGTISSAGGGSSSDFISPFLLMGA